MVNEFVKNDSILNYDWLNVEWAAASSCINEHKRKKLTDEIFYINQQRTNTTILVILSKQQNDTRINYINRKYLLSVDIFKTVAN